MKIREVRRGVAPLRIGASGVIGGGHWRDRPEAGSWIGIWLFRFVALHCGRPVARGLLYPITLYFYARRGLERRAARDFLHRLHGNAVTPWQVFRLLYAFAMTTLDRAFLMARGLRGFCIQQRGVQELRLHLDRGKGVLLLGAHVGSFEVLRALAADNPGYPLKLVMDRDKTPSLTRLLEKLAPAQTDSVVDTARGGLDIVLTLSEAARAGAMVAVLGDRGRRDELMRSVPFLGADAAFPAAPWLIAALLELPVVLCLGLYRGGNRYDLVFETLAERVVLPRGRRDVALDRYIARYAARLEYHLRQAPRNWFNFYDFWQPVGAGAADGADAPLERAHVA